MNHDDDGWHSTTSSMVSPEAKRYVRIPAELNMLEESLEIINKRAGGVIVRKDGADWVVEIG